MKVKDMIEELNKFPEDLELIFSKDEEGNSFYVIRDKPQIMYTKKLKWKIPQGEEVYSENELNEQKKLKMKKVVCLN